MADEVVKSEVNQKKNSGISPNTVVIVQAVACAILIFMVYVLGKVSPATFEFFKKEYHEIMSVDMSTGEIAQSVASAAQNTIGIKASAEDGKTEIEDTSADEQKDEVVAAMASADSSDRLVAPLKGRITSKYGYRTNPISGVYGLHTGVDIANDEGTTIVAAMSGVVTDTGTGEKRGKYVLMLHPDGRETLYCHCSKVIVDEGDVINAGEAIARVGSTGWSTGPHLHFEIRVDGSAVDPLTVIDEADIKE